MAIFIPFGIFKNFGKKEVVREGHEASTRVEGAPTPTGRAPYLVATSCASRTPFSCSLRILVGKNSLYKLPKVLTTVSRKYPLFSFRAISVADQEHHDVALLPREGLMSFPDCHLFFYFSKYSKMEKYCLKNCFGVGLLTVPHTYSFLESGTFWKVSFMYSSGVTVSIIFVSTFIGLPEI